jgi:hypothetical protein
MVKGRGQQGTVQAMHFKQKIGGRDKNFDRLLMLCVKEQDE